MQVVPVEDQQNYGEVVGVTEQPAPASGVVVGVLTEQPAPVSGVVVGVVTEQPGASSGGAARGVVDQSLAMLDGLDEGGRGSLEFLGRWNEKRGRDRAMPIKLTVTAERDTERDTETMVRVALGKLVDELVQNGASSGILAISREANWCRVSWSASPDDVSYQRHGFVGMESKQRQNIRFADFEGVVDDFGGEDQIAVHRVTPPSRGLDADKWVGRPPPLAPADLYTGPRSDGLLSTGEISGEYSAACACGDDGMPAMCNSMCNSMTVVPLGPDAIETWHTGCLFFPPFIGPFAGGKVLPRTFKVTVRGRKGTNTFGDMTFSADGTAEQGCGSYKKRPGSQKRAFHKVETRDLAGKWRGLSCVPFVPLWPFTFYFCTTKRALNENQYAEEGCGGWLCTLCLPLIPVSATRTRQYVNGHPTNGFASAGDIYWYRDPGCAGGPLFFAKKAG
jgi:hypothetical protein